MDWKLILQIAGIVLGLLYLWLEYRADIRLWIVGLIMPLVHGALYFKAGLYADCSMQVYYVLAGLYGWIVWRKASRRAAKAVQFGRSAAEPCDAASPTVNLAAGESGRAVRSDDPTVEKCGELSRTAEPAAARIRHTPLRYAAGLIAVYAAAHAGIYFVLAAFTNSTVPFWDAMTTAASIVAMWMLSRKYVEQWLVWLAVDLITVCLYLYKDIPLTAGLYALYSALAVAGYLRWRRAAAASSNEELRIKN